jgi:hypothetical protein
MQARRAVVGIALLAFASCTTRSTTQQDPPSVAPLGSPVAAPSGSSTPAATTAPLLAEGRNFGYIKRIDLRSDPRTIEFDLAEFLTGPDADRAAAEDGFIEPGEHADNDYYVRNRNKRLRSVPLGPQVTVKIVNWPSCCELTAGELAALAAAFESGGADDRYHGPSSGYWLTVRDGVVVGIEEQYVP